MYKTSQAWLIRKFSQGETSLNLCLFSEDEGIYNCRLRGHRNSKKKAIIEPFTALWLSKNSQGFCQKIENSAASMLFAPKNLFCGLYLNELIYYLIRPGEPMPRLYHLYSTTLNSLQTSRLSNLEVILRKFELQFLEILGYGLNFANIKLEDNYLFNLDDGFYKVSSGISGMIIKNIAKYDFTDLATLKSAKIIMRNALNQLLEGRQIKSRDLFGKL